MKWKDLSGEERYRVVQMARKGEMPIRELCRTFGVSRQTLNEAMEKADLAAMAELEPKPPGRKGPTPEKAALTEAKKEKSSLEKELDLWKTKYEIAMTFVELQRKVLNGEPLPGEEGSAVGKKKGWEREWVRTASREPPADRTDPDLAGSADGPGDGSDSGES
jgi:transposase-like protein